MTNTYQQAPLRGLHHVAYATKDPRATYDFYHTKLGMPLVHTENHKLMGGYFRHFFFDMGMGQHLGFFDVHGVGEKPDFKADLSFSLGLPIWVNHISFRLPEQKSYDAFFQRAKKQGIKVISETDHDFCQSMYMIDPNGIMIEFTIDTDASLFGQGHDEAYRLLFETPPEAIPEDAYKGSKNPKVKIY